MGPALICTVGMQGRIQALKKGGGGTHRVGLVGSCGTHSAQNFFQILYYFFSFCARIMHGVLGGSGGMLPQENFQI